MSNKNSNFPSNQLNQLPEGVCAETVQCLRELAERGKPTTVEELRSRIDKYFEFCAEHDFRCGIESLCLSLGVSRTTLWKWCREDGCSAEWAEVCQRAKQFILTFLEQITLTGRLNPASSIFYLKNWADYKDSISFDDALPTTDTRRVLSAAELPQLGGELHQNGTQLPQNGL